MTMRAIVSLLGVVVVVPTLACAGDQAATKKRASTPSVAQPTAPKPAPAPAVAAAKVEREVAPGPDTLYFDFNSSALALDTATKDRLSNVATYLLRNRSARVIIEGHADERGTVDYNLALGEQRARAAVDYLVRLGVHASQIVSRSFGEERPAIAARDEAGFAKNRRDEIRVEHSAGAGG